METKIISINISPSSNFQQTTENAGVMWEHNATSLVFNIDVAYVGEYKYYLEYRSLVGTKVRTQYLDIDTETNTVTYNIPIEMSSLKGVECYFNIVSIDGDGNTVQLIKPYKFYLDFEYSPDTDNSIIKVNDFSINALLEAIRLGTFKGDKGDKGETGEKGDKGEKGNTGEVTTEYANTNFAKTIRKTVSGKSLLIDDISSLTHPLEIKTKANRNVYVRGKNLIPFDKKTYNGTYVAGQTYTLNGVNFTVNEDGSVKIIGTVTDVTIFPLISINEYATGTQTVTLSGSPDGASASTYFLRLKNGVDAYSNYDEYGDGIVIGNTDIVHSEISIVLYGGQTVDITFYPQLEFGTMVTDYVPPVESQFAMADENGNVDGLTSVASSMSIFSDDIVECTYNSDTQKYIDSNIEKMEQIVKNKKYQLINSVELVEDAKEIKFTSDLNGNALDTLGLKKVFVLFVGRFTNTLSPLALYLHFNNTYQMYKNFTGITVDTLYGFWLESERMATFDNKGHDSAIFISRYPAAMCSNMTEYADGAIGSQGLSANNQTLLSDMSITYVESQKNHSTIQFGIPTNYENMFKTGSKFYLFGE